MASETPSPFSLAPVRWFVAFRVFFNARFYYPVFTILFLDFGLTLEQFAVLNAVWAASIVLAEVPSGALADVIGRRRLVVSAAALMVVEMALICFVPRGNPDLLFAVFVANRLCSGLAEAAASGADEALAYDALQQVGAEGQWGRVLEIQMRTQALGFIAAMSLGAALYDPALVGKALALLGFGFDVSQSDTLRLPLLATLCMAVLALFCAWQMTETPRQKENAAGADGPRAAMSVEAFRVTLRAGIWILKTPFALAVILSGLLFDATLRLVITLVSQYYRVIQIPEALYGLIGSALACLGLVIPRVAAVMSRKQSPGVNFWIVALLALAGLVGLVPTVPWFGVLPVAVLVTAMYMNGFFVSDYLNRVTESDRRATVLSFKGLSYNLAYGLAGIFYSMLLAGLKGSLETGGGASNQDAVFVASLPWFPSVFLILLVALAVYLGYKRPRGG
jgi:MFS family permease